MADAGSAGWTDERVALLGKLWAEGFSASQIATALGGGVTRNAVIGKVHRLGLSGRGKTAPAAAPVRPAPRQRPAAEDRPTGPIEAADTQAPAAVPDRRWGGTVAIPVSERVSILELRESSCRWPLGDPSSADFGFCGAGAVTGLPYCPAHCRIAYQPAAERKRLRA